MIIAEFKSQTPSTWKLGGLFTVAFSTLVLGLMKIVQSVAKDDADSRKESATDLRACLHVIHETLALQKGPQNPPEAWLRLTVYKVIGEVGDELEQVVPYVGAADAKPTQAGRRFSISVGVIGRCARAKQVRRVARPKDGTLLDWHQWLVDEAGMTAAQAQDTRSDRFDFLAIPIFDQNKAVAGVLYLDSSQPDLFDAATVEAVTGGCTGLAKWISERYG
jgi:hypothetical protein